MCPSQLTQSTPVQPAIRSRPSLNTQLKLYPLLVERQFVRRIWGGQRVADWLSLPEPRQVQIGESWQVFDTNQILNGLLSNKTLAEVTREYGVELVGTRTIERYGADFPLLTKFLDASGKSSIQVHPDDDYAHCNEATTGFHGKSEAWYVLSAAPGATIVSGLKQPCSHDMFAQAVRQNQVEQLLSYMPVQAGDTIYIPAGTVHTINAGILLYEIQQKSDLTYRVYDYGRIDSLTGKPRDLHLDKAMDVIRFTDVPRSKSIPTNLDEHGRRRLLMTSSHFALEHWTVDEEHCWTTDPGTLEILTVIDNTGILTWEDGHMPLHLGDSVVLPASLGPCTLRPLVPGKASTHPLRVLRAYIPQL
jgi:mannose-6-phosphate isomerase